MSFTEGILAQEYFNNTLGDYLIALSIIVLGTLAISIFKRTILNKLKKLAALSETDLDDLVIKEVDKFILPIVGFLFVYWGISYLVLSVKASHVIDGITSVIIAFFAIRLISSTLQIILESRIRKQENGDAKIKQVSGLMIIINIVIWVLGSVFLFDNLGYNVSALLTGVGIGGIAIALAAQNIIGDLFNYFVIFFDKPFEVGDSINVDDKNGTIEYIGLKTTRLRANTGEQIIIANSDLTKSRVHNFKRQETRRAQFTITVTYDTTNEKLEHIPELIKTIITSTEDTRFDRAHFARFTEYGLVFEVVYFVTVADYVRYMNIQQYINLKLIEVFKETEIQFLIRQIQG